MVPFNIACGPCFTCARACSRSARHPGPRARHRAALFGYTKLYGQVPGGQAEYLRVPHAEFGPIKVPEGPPDDRFLFLSDVLPTAWQAVQYAGIPEGGRWPCSAWARSATWRPGSPCTAASKVIGVDLVPERLKRAARGIDVRDLNGHATRRRDPGAHRRPRGRRGDRRGRHGGARLAPRHGRPADDGLIPDAMLRR